MNSISHTRLSFKSSFYIILLYVYIYFEFKINTFKPKGKSMQRLGIEAIRTEVQPSKPKWEITNITNSQYGQSRSSYFPKGGHSATETEVN